MPKEQFELQKVPGKPIKNMQMSKEMMCYIKQASSALLKGKTDWHSKGKDPETQFVVYAMQ